MGVTESIYLASDSAEESFGRSSEPLLFQLPAPPAQTLQIKLLPSARCALPSHPSFLLLNPMSSVLLLVPKLLSFGPSCFPLAFPPPSVVALSLLSWTLSGKPCALRLLSLRPTKNAVMTVRYSHRQVFLLLPVAPQTEGHSHTLVRLPPSCTQFNV